MAKKFNSGDILTAADMNAIVTDAETIKGEVSELKSDIDKLFNLNSITILRSDKFYKNKIHNLNNGVLQSYNNAVTTMEYIEKESNYITLSFPGTIICYDENFNYLRSTTPIVQGKKIRAYLTDDVKYIHLNFDYTNMVWYSFTEYIFDFDTNYVTYEYDKNGNKIQGISKNLSIKSEFPMYNIPIYATQTIIVPTKSGFSHCDDDGFCFLNDNNTSSELLIQVIYKNGNNNYPFFGRIGKPYNRYSVCCYGTSITNINVEGKYANWLKPMLHRKEEEFTVKGNSGGTFKTEIKNTILNDTNNYDIVFVEGCANDWAKGVTIEELTSAIKDIVGNLKTRCSKIYYVIDHTGRKDGSIDNSGTHIINGFTQRQYYLQAKTIFESFGVQCIDAGLNSGISEFTPECFVDTIHHSDLGGCLFAKAIVTELNNKGYLSEPIDKDYDL